MSSGSSTPAPSARPVDTKISLISPPWPILLMSWGLGIGGTERQLAEIALSLDRRFFLPYVGAFHAEGMRVHELLAADIPVIEFPVRSFIRPSIFSVSRSYVAWLREHRIALVHAFDPGSVLFSVPLARLAGTPVVLSSLRGERPLVASWLQQQFLKITDRLAKGIVANSQFMRRMLIEYGADSNRISVCYNGLDTNTFHTRDRQRQPGLETASCVIGCVSAQRPEKQLETLIRAFDLVRRQHPTTRLALVGDGESRRSLEELSRFLDLGSSILFVPANKDVAPWYRSIDIFVLPSRTEAFSNSLLEAMACGCCVVASNVGGNPEAVTASSGVLFESGNVEQLAATLDSLVRDTPRRERLALQASQRVSIEFSRSASIECIENVYKSFLEGCR